MQAEPHLSSRPRWGSALLQGGWSGIIADTGHATSDGRSFPVYQDYHQDWTIYDDSEPVGHIYEDTSASAAADQHWFWSLTVHVDPNAGIATRGKVATLSEARRRGCAVGPPGAMRSGSRTRAEIDYGPLISPPAARRGVINLRPS